MLTFMIFFYFNKDYTFSSWRIGSSMLVFLRIWPMLLYTHCLLIPTTCKCKLPMILILVKFHTFRFWQCKYLRLPSPPSWIFLLCTFIRCGTHYSNIFNEFFIKGTTCAMKNVDGNEICWVSEYPPQV